MEDPNIHVADLATELAALSTNSDHVVHVTYAVDVGGVTNRGAARLAGGMCTTFSDIDEMLEAVVVDLADRPVAIGFESPLWIPVRESVADATKARMGEGARPWSAGAGASVLAAGLGILATCLAVIAQRAPNTRATVSVDAWENGDANLLIYEAFISATMPPLTAPAQALPGSVGHVADLHQLDALHATTAFEGWIQDPQRALTITKAPSDRGVVNLAIACADAVGLQPVGPRHAECVVVAARKPTTLPDG